MLLSCLFYGQSNDFRAFDFQCDTIIRDSIDVMYDKTSSSASFFVLDNSKKPVSDISFEFTL